MIELINMHNTVNHYFSVVLPPFAEDSVERTVAVCVKAASVIEAEIFLSKFYRHAFMNSNIKPVLIDKEQYDAIHAAKIIKRARYGYTKDILKKTSRGGTTKRGSYEKKIRASGVFAND